MSVIGFVILHYGNVQVTKDCVDSILQLHTEDDIRIVVVDNDTNKSMEERQVLKDTVRLNPKVEVIQMQEKSGFSRANNEGYAYMREKHRPDYVVLANNDIVFEQKDFIDKIKFSYQKNQYTVLSPDIVSRKTGEHQSPIDTRTRRIWQVNYTIIMNWLCLKCFSLLYPFIRGQFQAVQSTNDIATTYQENIVPCGACIVFARDFIEHEEYALFPETEFYYEEYILHYRCKMLKYKIVYEPMAQVLHGDGLATKKSVRDEKDRIRFIMAHTLRSAKIYKKLLYSGSILKQ